LLHPKKNQHVFRNLGGIRTCINFAKKRFEIL
ncbi:MAG: hypothetical protein ACI9VI_000410, partial [Candidatus Azotimanducaceae bacterium]